MPPLGFQCVHGLLAAVIMSAQFFLVKTSEQLLPLLAQESSLAPFPFRTSQYTLYSNMIPVRLSMCDRTREKDSLHRSDEAALGLGLGVLV